MGAQCEITADRAAEPPWAPFERYLTVWVFLAIAGGIALGRAAPGVFATVGRAPRSPMSIWSWPC